MWTQWITPQNSFIILKTSFLGPHFFSFFQWALFTPETNAVSDLLDCPWHPWGPGPWGLFASLAPGWKMATERQADNCNTVWKELGLLTVLDLWVHRGTQVGLRESHMKEKEAQEWIWKLNRIHQVDKDSDEVGKWVWSFQAVETWAKKYAGRECVFTEWEAVPRGYEWRVPSGMQDDEWEFGASLTSCVKDFGFQSINSIESVNNLSRWNIIRFLLTKDTHILWMVSWMHKYQI